MLMAKNDRFSGKHYRNALETAGESEGSGSSGRLDMEIAASGDTSTLLRKCINLNANKRNSSGVPVQVLPLSNMLPSQRKQLLKELRFELQRIRAFQKKVESQRMSGVPVPSSSDILSYSMGSTRENMRKSTGQVKKETPQSIKARGWNRGTSGRFECAQEVSVPNTANAIIMKQCDTLLKRLMSHQYGWVFNAPVDVEKLKIPDYLIVIKHPMDLGTIKEKITAGAYSSPLEFLADVRLTFNNAMTYNPPGNDVYIMADTLSKFFEIRWKSIEKKLQGPDVLRVPAKSGPQEELENTKSMPSSKKRKFTAVHHEVNPEPVKRVMTDEEKLILGTELQPLLCEMPERIIDFLKEHCSSGGESGEDEIEIDINELSDDTLFTLRKLVDDYLQEKQKGQGKAEPCEIELLHDSGLSNSSMQPFKGDDPVDEDVDIGGNEPPVSSYPPIEIEKDVGPRSSKCFSPVNSSGSSSSESETDNAKASSPLKSKETLDSGAQLDEKICNPIDRDYQSVSGLDQHDQTSQQKSSPVESDCCHDGASAPSEKPVSPERLYRAAVLKNRFADTILKAREKTLLQGGKKDPEKLRKEREELEMQRRKEKARLQAEAKAAEDARRRAEAEAAAEAAAEAKRKRELEREAARQALLQIEKTVEINENAQFLEDLEMLRAPAEQLPSSVDETSPEHCQDGLTRLGSFSFGGSNPLEQLGLYMKMDEEEEECEALPSLVNPPLKEEEEEEESKPPNPAADEVEDGECEAPAASLPNSDGNEMEDMNHDSPPPPPPPPSVLNGGNQVEDGECDPPPGVPHPVNVNVNVNVEVEEGEID